MKRKIMLGAMLEEKNFCTIYLVRHGETEWNKKGLIMGQSDSPLTEIGVKQMEAAAGEMKNIEFDAIYSSDLLRAKRTAEIVKLDREIAVQTSRALRERAYGRFEGNSTEAYKKFFNDAFAKIMLLSEKERTGYKLDADVESDDELMARLITQLREIAVAYPGKNVLVVSHGSCIRTFLTHVGYVKFGDLQTGAISNGGRVVVLCDGIDFFIKEVTGIRTA